MKKFVTLSTVLLLACMPVYLEAQEEDATFAIKQKIIKQDAAGKFEMKCLESADTLTEANACLKKSHELGSEGTRTHFDSWNEAEKKKTLAELEEVMEMGECIKKAKTMMEIQTKCFK